MTNYSNEYTGDIKISDDVIATLAVKAAKEIEGVTGMVGGIVGNIAAAVLGKKDASRGVDVDMKEGVAVITLHIKVKYGMKIPEIAWKVQENVKTMVESITGISVDKINISVEAVDFAEDAPATEPEITTPAEIIDIDVTEEN